MPPTASPCTARRRDGATIHRCTLRRQHRGEHDDGQGYRWTRRPPPGRPASAEPTRPIPVRVEVALWARYVARWGAEAAGRLRAWIGEQAS